MVKMAVIGVSLLATQSFERMMHSRAQLHVFFLQSRWFARTLRRPSFAKLWLLKFRTTIQKELNMNFLKS